MVKKNFSRFYGLHIYIYSINLQTTSTDFRASNFFTLLVSNNIFLLVIFFYNTPHTHTHTRTEGERARATHIHSDKHICTHTHRKKDWKEKTRQMNDQHERVRMTYMSVCFNEISGWQRHHRNVNRSRKALTSRNETTSHRTIFQYTAHIWVL